MTSPRTAARIVGSLMLAAFFLYGIGTSVATTATTGTPSVGIGAGMMLLNTAAVIAIGVVVYPVLRRHSPRVAVGYLTTRIFEGTLLAIGAITLLNGAADANTLAYNVAMAGLGIGSLFFCAVLYRARLVPRFLAAWGFIGYASFAAGCVLELFGVAGAGLPATIPGGLFELFFATWLLVRGFSSPAAEPAGEGARTVPLLATAER